MYPHINIGLYNGVLSHEFAAIDGIKSLCNQGLVPEGVVFIIMIPTPHTPMADAPLISPGAVDRVFRYANDLDIDLILGCMRPKMNAEYNYTVEMAAIRNGIKRIAMPSRRLMEYISASGMDINTVDTCCIF